MQLPHPMEEIEEEMTGEMIEEGGEEEDREIREIEVHKDDAFFMLTTNQTLYNFFYK